ncbi:MAG: hypothetical protein HY906_22375 [Deltaproteobacteria bacterium]|nr:hypothetical protein [Deltaproteobacteria bacterium]
MADSPDRGPLPPGAVPPGVVPPATVPLHVAWPRPTLMLPMGSVLVWVDGQPAWRGPFEQGVDVTVPVLPGRHRVDVRIDVEGLFARDRSYEVDVPGPTRLDLHYSRFWGSFSKQVTPRPGP